MATGTLHLGGGRLRDGCAHDLRGRQAGLQPRFQMVISTLVLSIRPGQIIFARAEAVHDDPGCRRARAEIAIPHVGDPTTVDADHPAPCIQGTRELETHIGAAWAVERHHRQGTFPWTQITVRSACLMTFTLVIVFLAKDEHDTTATKATAIKQTRQVDAAMALILARILDSS